MLDHDLQLLQSAVPALGLIVDVATGRAPRALLRLSLIGVAEPIDLLPQAANVTAKRVDDRIELRIEVVCIARNPRRLAHRGSV